MDKLDNIFCYPEIVDGIEIYPIRMFEYDKFMQYANILTLSYDHFNKDEIEKLFTGELSELFPKDGFKLLELVFLFYTDPSQHDLLIEIFSKIFSFVTHQDVTFDKETTTFFIGDSLLKIDRSNYDVIREIILKQNLIFSPPLYKNKLVQEWVDLAVKARAQSSLKITNEAMITTISAHNGMDINLLANYSYYQVSALFQRILKFKGYDTSILFRSVGGEVPIDHFAEDINMLKNPYDDVIKDSSYHKHIEDSIYGRF